jgi:hypothetical protein
MTFGAVGRTPADRDAYEPTPGAQADNAYLALTPPSLAPQGSVDALPRIGQDSEDLWRPSAEATWRGGRPMCGHEFMFHHRDYLQRYRPRWPCGTCGRVSSVPLDCCTRPDFTQHRPAQLTSLLSQWMSTCRRWALASVRLLWGLQRRSATRAGATQATASLPNTVTASVIIPPADYDESPEGDDVMVAAGERQ